MNSQPASKTGEYTILAVGLSVMEIILAWLMVVLTRDIATASGDARTALVDLFRIGMVALCVNTLLIFWVFLRSLRAVFRGGRGGKSGKPASSYVDAWALAGKRLKLDDDEEDDDSQPESN